MADGEVSRLLTRLRRLGLQIVGTLAEMVVVQFLLKGLIGGLREHRLFLKDGQDTHGLRRGKRRDTRQKFVLRISAKSNVTYVHLPRLELIE